MDRVDVIRLDISNTLISGGKGMLEILLIVAGICGALSCLSDIAIIVILTKAWKK